MVNINMVIKNKGVIIRVDNSFFDNFFEPNRKKLERKLGMKVTQQKFTKMIKGFKFNQKLSREFKNVPIRKTKKK